MTEVEPNLLPYGRHTRFLPTAQRDAAGAEAALEKLRAALRVLDGALEGSLHLAGESFGVADLNVASVLSWAGLVQLDVSRHARVQCWLDACRARPAAAIREEPQV